MLAMLAVRNLAKGRSIENLVSAGMLLPLLISLGFAASALHDRFPLWGVLASSVVIAVYAVAARRDVSFLGMFAVGWLLGGVGWATMFWLQLEGRWTLWWAFLAHTVWIWYFVYDFSMLLRRRRLGEELAATADLYRDVFNWTTYWARVIQHWRRHRFWAKLNIQWFE